MNDDDSDNHTVDTEDTGHDNRNNRFHDEFGFENTHGTDTNTGFGAAIGGTKVGEDKGGGDSDIAKEVVIRHI